MGLGGIGRRRRRRTTPQRHTTNAPVTPPPRPPCPDVDPRGGPQLSLSLSLSPLRNARQASSGRRARAILGGGMRRPSAGANGRSPRPDRSSNSRSDYGAFGARAGGAWARAELGGQRAGHGDALGGRVSSAAGRGGAGGRGRESRAYDAPWLRVYCREAGAPVGHPGRGCPRVAPARAAERLASPAPPASVPADRTRAHRYPGAGHRAAQPPEGWAADRYCPTPRTGPPARIL